MPAQYVKPYVKRSKNDAADAEAICEAVARPAMRFVPVKTPEQQSVMMLHRVRLMLNRQRTQLSNAMRAHLAEFGIVAPIGRNGLDQLIAVIADEDDIRVPACARICLTMLAAQLAADGDSRRRPPAGERIRGHHCRPDRVQEWAWSRCLDRAGAQAEFLRRQGAPGQHNEGG